METIENKVKKPSANDPFDLDLLIRGVLLQLIEMGSNLYEFSYTFTFKRTMKAYAGEFNDPFEKMIDQWDFFLDTGDPVVINCVRVEQMINKLAHDLRVLFGLDLQDVVADQMARHESARFAPLRLLYKRSKSYKQLKLCYEQSILDYIAYFYRIATVITVGKYKIPPIFNKQFILDEHVSLWLLNSDDATVVLLQDMIGLLRLQLEDLRAVPVKKKSKSRKLARS